MSETTLPTTEINRKLLRLAQITRFNYHCWCGDEHVKTACFRCEIEAVILDAEAAPPVEPLPTDDLLNLAHRFRTYVSCCCDGGNPHCVRCQIDAAIDRAETSAALLKEVANA